METDSFRSVIQLDINHHYGFQLYAVRECSLRLRNSWIYLLFTDQLNVRLST